MGMMMRLWFNGHGRLPAVAGRGTRISGLLHGLGFARSRGTRRVVASVLDALADKPPVAPGIDALAGPDASGPVAPVVIGVLVVLFGVSSVFGGENPTLDELLEIEPPQQVDGEKRVDGAVEVQEAGLVEDMQVARDIAGDGSPAALFDQAVKQMGDAARRLGVMKDAGVVTQRIQQEVIARLDQVIAKSRQSGGGKGKGKPQKKEQGSKENQQKPQRQPSPGQPQGSQSNPDVAGHGEVGETATGGVMAETRQQWGQLPPRLRDELSQGQSETFSGMYRSMTEQYYQRVAEESE